jgi:hypothetical protein
MHRDLKQDDLIVIAGAGGFIGGSLVRYFHDLGYTHIRAVDKKPLSNWYHACGYSGYIWTKQSNRVCGGGCGRL